MGSVLRVNASSFTSKSKSIWLDGAVGGGGGRGCVSDETAGDDVDLRSIKDFELFMELISGFRPPTMIDATGFGLTTGTTGGIGARGLVTVSSLLSFSSFCWVCAIRLSDLDKNSVKNESFFFFITLSDCCCCCCWDSASGLVEVGVELIKRKEYLVLLALELN